MPILGCYFQLYLQLILTVYDQEINVSSYFENSFLDLIIFEIRRNYSHLRGVSRTPLTSKTEFFLKLVNG